MFIERETEDILRKSGWSENRKLDKQYVLKQLESEGYPILDNVVAFMQNVGDLIIYFKNKRNGLPSDDINFDFDHATHLEVPERIFKSYGPRIQKKLVLIGSAYRDHFVLIMDEDNCVYGGYDNFLCKIGDTPFNAIENIILDKDFIEIP